MEAVTKLTIATRGSRLALWQAEHIKALLQTKYPQLEIEFLVVKTQGDIILDVPLAKVGGKGLFVKEIEETLLNGQADVAVHSMKDVPMELPAGLVLGVIPEREDVADMFLSARFLGLSALASGATVGTSSLRRQSQILAIRPDIQVIPLRGNVDTRLRKLQEGQFDAIIMAAAGIKRLGLTAPYTERLTPPRFLPAAGQGALGLEYREDRQDLAEMFKFMDDFTAHVCVQAERGFLAELNGSCQVPIAASAHVNSDKTLSLSGLIARLDGKEIVRISGNLEQPNYQNSYELGRKLASQILEQGGRSVLNAVLYAD